MHGPTGGLYHQPVALGDLCPIAEHFLVAHDRCELLLQLRRFEQFGEVGECIAHLIVEFS